MDLKFLDTLSVDTNKYIAIFLLSIFAVTIIMIFLKRTRSIMFITAFMFIFMVPLSYGYMLDKKYNNQNKIVTLINTINDKYGILITEKSARNIIIEYKKDDFLSIPGKVSILETKEVVDIWYKIENKNIAFYNIDHGNYIAVSKLK